MDHVEKIRKAVNDLNRYTEALKQPEQVADFYRTAQAESVFLSACTSMAMSTTKTMHFAMTDTEEDDFLNPGFEAQPIASNQEYAPTLSSEFMTSHVMKGRMRITAELLDQVIGSPEAFRNLLTQFATDRMSRDLEDFHMLGVGPGGGVGYANRVSANMRLKEGLVEQITDVNPYDFAGSTLTEDKVLTMLAQIESQYITNLQGYLNHRALLALQKDIATRTTNRGDTAIQQDPLVSKVVATIPFNVIPRIPTTWGTQASKKSFLVLANMKLAQIGYFQAPTFKEWTDPQTDVEYFIGSVRTGNRWKETRGVVFGANLGGL